MNYKNQNIIFFDGYCNLCNGFVQLIIKNLKDRNAIKFCSLQSSIARIILDSIEGLEVNNDDFTTVIFYLEGSVFTRSKAVFKMIPFLKWYFQPFLIFNLVPTTLCDWFYGKVSKNRYNWFGKQTTCLVPTPQLKSMFLEELSTT